MNIDQAKMLKAIYATVNHAVRSGVLISQPCRICGNVKSVAHHQDYSKPLDVLWYCRKHHMLLHSILGSFLHTMPPHLVNSQEKPSVRIKL